MRHPVSKHTSIVTCFLLVCILSGCGAGKGRETVSLLPLPISVQDVIMKLAAMRDSVGMIRATARITVTAPGMTYSRKMALLLQMPSNLRLEAIPIFGPADFFLSANEQSLKMFFPGQGKFYVGAPTPENFSLFFKVSIPPSDVVPLFIGVPPEVIGGQHSGHGEGSVYRIDSKYANKKRSLWIDRENQTVMKWEEKKDDRILWRVLFMDYTVVGKVSLPNRIQIEGEEPERVEIEIQYLQRDMTPSTSDTAPFNLPIPPGIIPKPLEH